MTKNYRHSRLLTVKEVAEELGVSEGFIRSKVFQKKIPFLKIGSKLVRFNREEVMKWAVQIESISKEKGV